MTDITHNSGGRLAKNLSLIFNTHIPYVLQEKEIFNEQENWIFESLTETYIPLFEILSELNTFNLNSNQVVLSFTPCTIKQLVEGKERYLKYLYLLKNVALAEVERTTRLDKYNIQQKNKQNLSDEELKNLNNTARFYLERTEKSIRFYENNDIREVIKNLKNVQLWTSTPNHNFLPIFNEKTADYFVKRGIEDFEKSFGRMPDGFWLPECGFYPGIEKILTCNGITSTSLNINSIGFFTGNEKSGIYKYDDLKLYIHDFRICKYLWKAPKNTIPSQPVYREFYRDLGFDVYPEYLTSLGIPIPDKRKGTGIWTGFKYFAISEHGTSLGDKVIYDLDKAMEQVKKDAMLFFSLLEENRELTNDYCTFVLAFDTEFFGHWWMEGIWWLKEVFKHVN